MSTHNLCFEQKYEKISEFLSEKFHFLVVKLSVYLNRLVFVMYVYEPIQEKVSSRHRPSSVTQV